MSNVIDDAAPAPPREPPVLVLPTTPVATLPLDGARATREFYAQCQVAQRFGAAIVVRLHEERYRAEIQAFATEPAPAERRVVHEATERLRRAALAWYNHSPELRTDAERELYDAARAFDDWSLPF